MCEPGELDGKFFWLMGDMQVNDSTLLGTIVLLYLFPAENVIFTRVVHSFELL